MKRFSVAALVGGVLLSVAGAGADFTTLSDMGISVWVPSGWELQNVESTDTTRLYLLDDTTFLSDASGRRHSGAIYLQARSGVKAEYSAYPNPARQWVLNEGEAWNLYITTAPYGGFTLGIDDTTQVSGLFAWEVYGQSLQTVGDSVMSDYVLITAHGDVGWEFWAESDTTDMDSAVASTYSVILDTIEVDTTVSVLPPAGIATRSAKGALSQALSAVGGRLRIRASAKPQVEAMDLMGRSIAGTLSSGGDGIWYWRPRAARTATILARVRADGSVWARRLVLDPP